MEVYMDNAATTKPHMQGDIDSSVLAMYGNPSSAHALGKQAREQVESAREKLAQYIGCEVEEIIFTSGGTEANNLALFGLARGNPTKKHIIVSAIEHDSILEVCSVLHKDGYKIDYIGVNSEGIVDPQDVLRRITP